jgi:hypothetical protein
MRSKKIIFSSMACLLTTPALAMMCPGNFNEVNFGDSLDAVKQQCGVPMSETTSDSEAKVPQEWNYFVQVPSELGYQAVPGGEATIKATVGFNNGVVTNMSVNGIGISSTTICNGNNVSVGDTQESVKKACGTPAFINKGNIDTPPKMKITDLTYMNGDTPVIFEFEDGVFKSKK